MQNFYKSFKFLGLGVLKAKHLVQLQKIEFDIKTLFTDLAQRNGAIPQNIKSQIGQDLFVLLELNWKRNGFFVEFGATNGVGLSNTYLLEKSFEWTGILAEPAMVWHEDLQKNRSAALDFDCVWRETGEKLNFTSSALAEFSTITEFAGKDAHSRARKYGDTYEVKTVSLNDLLDRHNAPQNIDYLSIDTEGSEFDILQSFDFNRHRISVITCEHNFSAQREKIYQLLVSNGFSRVYEGFSRWDDWFVNREAQS